MIDTYGRFARLLPVTAIALTAIVPSAAVYAQATKVNSVINEQAQVEQAAAASQARIAQLDDETTQMLSDYRSALAEAESLKVYNESLAKQVESQKEEMTSITQQLAEIESTAREVLPMMTKMVSTLQQFVKLDMPFLPEERAKRMADLDAMMAAADVTVSEKYRRIVEAYQIEMEYGRTIESYPGKIEDRNVTFLRAGRVALMYQTPDGAETGYWDMDQNAWVVDNGYHDAVENGLKIANKQTAPDLMVAPVRVTEGG